MTALRKIAIVEDDREICRQLEDFLGNNGYECIIVTEYRDVGNDENV